MTIIWAANRHPVARHGKSFYTCGSRRFSAAAEAISWAKAFGERARRNRMQRLARKRSRR